MDKKILRLIKRIVYNADKKAANSLVEIYYDEIFGFINKRVNSIEVAKEVTQDILVNMLQSIENFDEKKASFRTWLYVIAKRQLVNYYNSKGYKNDQLYHLDDLSLNHLVSMYENAQSVCELADIRSFIDSLDPKSREIFLLKVFDQYTFAKISEITRIPESSVKNNFYSTQELVRREFLWEN